MLIYNALEHAGLIAGFFLAALALALSSYAAGRIHGREIARDEQRRIARSLERAARDDRADR